MDFSKKLGFLPLLQFATTFSNCSRLLLLGTLTITGSQSYSSSSHEKRYLRRKILNGSAATVTCRRLHRLFCNTLVSRTPSQTFSPYQSLALSTSHVTLTYQWSNLLFLLYIYVIRIYLVDSQHFKLTL